MNFYIFYGGYFMIKQLRKVGNCKVLVLEQAVLKRLGLGEDIEDEQVQVTIKDGNLIVTPARRSTRPLACWSMHLQSRNGEAPLRKSSCRPA